MPTAGLLDAILSKPVTASAMHNAVGQARSKWAGQQEDGTGRREGARLAGLSILVADDSDINCEVARRILENEGARVLLAADGGQALETLRVTPDGSAHRADGCADAGHGRLRSNATDPRCSASDTSRWSR